MLRAKLVGKSALHALSFKQIGTILVGRKIHRNTGGIYNVCYFILCGSGITNVNKSNCKGSSIFYHLRSCLSDLL